MKKEYIHYGSLHFSEEKFDECKNQKRNLSRLNKPNFGFWGSPVDTDWGWKDWCKSEYFCLESFDKSFRFRLKNGSRILKVRMVKDVIKYTYERRIYSPSMNCYFNDGYGIKFYEIMRKYDGLELIHGDHYHELHSGPFYTWDCDSIVIWNPGIIEEVR